MIWLLVIEIEAPSFVAKWGKGSEVECGGAVLVEEDEMMQKKKGKKNKKEGFWVYCKIMDEDSRFI